ncbi:SLC34A2 [Branchiostoma lanceolatum]|uniref:SLC34A2 protein n=1 Tax=Branchiostoma lanceolatum TaxID=7740 RepID=A0A8K0AAN3_BRALA|nr:SLC34A2 [Branchiostoma lanceolatum]
MGKGSDKKSEENPPTYNDAIAKSDVAISVDGEDKKKIVEEEEFDPWNVPELKDDTVPWDELTDCGKVERVILWFLKPVLLLGLLYMFICSLDFLSSAFRLLGGKAAGELFAQNELLKNPVCGLMIGVLVTVLVQSSSTSTSIVVSMVGAGILEVEQSIYIVMGANIGTSVTNTIVSLGHSGDKNEFRRAFAGATIHDMFNWLCVFILLPLEAASHYLFRLSTIIVNSFQFTGLGEIKLLKVITEPFTKLIVEIDKGVITDIALSEGATEQSLLKRYCKTGPLVLVNSTEEQVTFLGNGTYNWTITENVTTSEWKHQCQYLFAQVNLWNDTIVGVILLVAALLILCICLACIVKLLHSILKGALARVIKRAVHAELPTKVGKYLTGYLIIILGAGMTFLVQSSSIFTSALTPLIAIGVVNLKRAYPLTLGANIGTTTTAILAALASSGDGLVRSLQLALCHFFFNVSGIILWYPIPPLRNVPIGLAKKLGNTTAKYRWFAIVYLILMFFLWPALVFGLSVAGWETLVGVGVPLLVFALVVVVINVLQTKRPNWLPKKLRTWDFLPLALHSLEPYDRLLTGCCKKKSAEQAANDDERIEIDNPGFVTEQEMEVTQL